MSNKSKILSIAVVAIAAIVVAVVFVPDKKVSDWGTDISKQPMDESALNSDSRSTPLESNQPSTIAEQWQWQKLDDQSEQSPMMSNDTALPFTTKSVYDALQAVKVDENGDIILDHDALVSLDEALERIHNKLDGESLLELQDLIKEALPGKVGEQTAKLVGDYDQFLAAKEQFSQMYEGSGSSQQTLASIKSDEALYGELQALREVYLGRDVTENLFHVSDANAKFMFDNMKLDMDSSLTAEEKEQRRKEIEEQFNQVVP